MTVRQTLVHDLSQLLQITLCPTPQTLAPRCFQESTEPRADLLDLPPPPGPVPMSLAMGITALHGPVR